MTHRSPGAREARAPRRRRGAARAGATLLALTVLAATLAGCGLGAGKSTSSVTLTVTRDFGDHVLGEHQFGQTSGSETVLRLLQRSFKVTTRYGGGFVQSIDGIAGGTAGGRQVDWFYYVNGIEADRGSASARLHAGDHVWWDWHDWGTAMRIPAVVGAFPEPFRSGSGGHRLPVRIDCAPDAEQACRLVGRKLRAIGVPTSSAVLGAPNGIDVLRLVVGPWKDVRSDGAAALIGYGPKRSGVFVQPDASATRFALLDARGRTTRTLGAGSGLIAATRYQEQQPAWVVTGTDMAGTLAAAEQLTQETLHNRFAVAVSGDAVQSLPVGQSP